MSNNKQTQMNLSSKVYWIGLHAPSEEDIQIILTCPCDQTSAIGSLNLTHAANLRRELNVLLPCPRTYNRKCAFKHSV